MVSGFNTSPYDQLRMVSGDARLILNEVNPLVSTQKPPEPWTINAQKPALENPLTSARLAVVFFGNCTSSHYTKLMELESSFLRLFSPKNQRFTKKDATGGQWTDKFAL